MIGLVLRFLSNPLAVGVIGIAAALGAYQVGKTIGHAQGVAQQIADQAAADLEQQQEIRERVRDALDQAGAGSSDDDIDRILRGLAGDGSGED